MDEKIKIVIVEDEEEARETLMEVLENPRYEIEGFPTAEDGWDFIQETDPDILLCDLMLPGQLNGIDLLDKVKSKYPAIEVIMITGHATVETAINAMKIGAFDYLVKPIDISRLRLLVEKASENRIKSIEDNALAKDISSGKGFFGMYGISEEFQSIVKRIRLVAPTESNVLITGESGTGKELAADAIHHLSKRKDGPLVKVNINAIPESLIESELFGHVKGAFTGAEKHRKGMFKQADNGTILLDEIGDMPYHLQAKLLRAIETKNITPLGAEKMDKLSFRVVSSTNKDLEQMIKEEKFREDLYFRLGTFAIKLPPLRERKEDIPILCQSFFERVSERIGKKITGIAPEILTALKEYSWPGNIRQLASAMEEMALLSEGEILDQPPGYIKLQKSKIVVNSNDTKESNHNLEDMEKDAIIKALDETNGNKKAASEKLGIGLRTLYRKIKKYDIED